MCMASRRTQSVTAQLTPAALRHTAGASSGSCASRAWLHSAFSTSTALQRLSPDFVSAWEPWHRVSRDRARQAAEKTQASEAAPPSTLAFFRMMSENRM